MPADASARKKPHSWPTAAGMDPLWRELLGNAPTLVVPMLEGNPAGGTYGYGLLPGVLRPQVAGTLSRFIGRAGQGISFDSDAASHGLTTGRTHKFSKVSIFAVVNMEGGFGVGQRYYRIAGRGDNFKTNSQFNFSFRQNGGGTIQDELHFSLSDGAGGAGRASNDQITAADLGIGTRSFCTLACSADDNTVVFYINGIPWGGGSLTKNLSTINSTDPLTIGAGTGMSSYSRTFNKTILSIIIADGFWSEDQHAMLARSPFGWQKRRTWFIPAASGGAHTITPSGGLSIGGTTDILKSRAFLASGGITLAGEQAMIKTHVAPVSGGLALGGTATMNSVHVMLPSGGLLMGGSSAFSTHNAVHSIAPAGGLLFDGTAPMYAPAADVFSPIHEVVRDVVRRVVYRPDRDDDGSGDWQD